MKPLKTLAIAVGGLCALPAAAHGKAVKNNDAASSGAAMMHLNAAELSTAPAQNYAAANHGSARQIYGGSMWQSLKSDFRLNEVNSGLVRSHENKFASNREYFNRTINRSKPYMFHITNEVKKRGMPAEIALLPFIESAYVTKARSRVGASGLWQFMPATGRHYGLEQTPLYDGRHDVYAATDAALNYLQYLYGLFGDWSLALGAYNWGEGNMSRAVRQAQAAGLRPTYENLRLPAETRNYVPKLLAVRNLVSNPQAFGINLPDIQNTPYFTAVNVDAPMDVMAAAHLANISESEFLALNPGFKTPVFIPKNGRKMLLPVTAAKTFETNYRNADSRSLLSWDVFTPSYQMNINDIAAQTNTPVAELRRLNGLNGGRVAAGKSILVSRFGNGNSGSNQNIKLNFAKADNDPVPDTYVEQAPLNLAADLSRPKAETAQQRKQAAFVNFVENTNPAPAAAPQQAQAAPPAPAVQAAAETAAVQPPQNVLESAFNAPASSLALDGGDNTAAASGAIGQDPLMSLASLAKERQRALQATRSAVAQANREEAAREKAERVAAERAARAAKLAEAKEAKRREQERLRAEKIQQAQQLAAIRQAREAGASVPQAIRASAKPQQHGGTHKVQEGDTLYNIAQRYNLNVADLISANNIRNNHIRIGQVLKLSVKKTNPLQKVSDSRRAALGLAPASYTVRKGDTLHGIASRYNLNVNEIKKLNKVNDGLKTGQTIRLIAS